MLVLTRKISESVRLTCDDGTEIVVTVLGWRTHGGIKLGFTAPPHVEIMRSELVDRTTDRGAEK